MKKKLDNIEKYLNSDRIYQITDSFLGENINRAYRIMREDLYRLIEGEGEDLNVRSCDLESIIFSVDGLIKYMIYKNDKKFQKFIRDYWLLVKNWNRVVSSECLERGLSAIKFLIDLQSNINDWADDYKELVEEIRVSRNFNPPSYKLKKGYFKGLQEKYEGRGY